MEHKGSEIINVSHTITHGRQCMGCIRHNKDIMVTIVKTPIGEQYTDLFLTTDQAKVLVEQIQKRIEGNNKPH